MRTLPPIASSRPRKILAGTLAVVYLATNVVGVHAAESGFWTSRREAVRQRQRPVPSKAAAPITVAGLPSGFELPAYQPRSLGAPLSSETDSAAVTGIASRRLSEADLPRWLADVVSPHGAIRDVHLSGRPSAPLVIHIQDLHDSVEAQRHIAGLITDLQDARGVSLVGLEGAQGEFALGAFRSYPDAGLLRQVADHLMTEGFLGGPEFAGLTSAQPPLLWGVEDSKLYEANLAVVKESARRRPSLEAFTAKARSVLTKVKDRRLPARLMDFDQRLSAYHDGRLPLGDFVKYLLRVAPTPTLRYGNLHLLKDALVWEAQLDKKKIESDRALILDQLARRLPRTELDHLVAQSALYRLGRMNYGEFHRFFRGLCLRHGVALDEHTHFNNYIRYILLAERINRNDLFVELETLTSDVQTLLCLTPDERRVMAASRHLSLIERLARHAYTPMDWRYHETHAAALKGVGAEIALLAREAGVPTDLVSPPEDLFRPFEAFCGDAINRNAALVRGVLEKMRSENKATAVLVAGGFHTDGLTHLLRQQGVSYAVITPKVTGAPPAGSKTLDLLASDPAPLEKLFAGETLNIPTPRLTAVSNAKLPLARRLVMLKAALLAALTVFATNAPLSSAAVESLQSWPVVEKISGRARSPTEAAIAIQTEDGQKIRLRAVAGAPVGVAPDYRGTVGGTDVSLDAVDPAASISRRLQDRWDAMFFVGILSRRRKAAPLAPAPLDTTPFPVGQDPWGARDAGDRAILDAVESTSEEPVFVFSGDVDLSAKANASIGKLAVGSIQESTSLDLVAARGPSPFWEIRAALAAAMKEAGADIYAGAGGDEFRGIARGEDAPRRLARANQRLNAHFVGRYQFFQIAHPHPDDNAVRIELANKVRQWVDGRTPGGMFRLVRFGNGFTLVVPRADRRWRTSADLRRVFGSPFRVRERVLERAGLGPLTVSMGVISHRMAKKLLISVAGARLADSARALAVWVQRFANDALGEAKNRGRNQVFAPASQEELTGVLKKGSVTVQHIQQLREQIERGTPPTGLAAVASDGKTRVLPLGEFWSRVKERREDNLDLYVFTVVRYMPTRRGAIAQRINDTLRRLPARYRRWVPGSLLRRVDAYIQKRAFHEYQGSDYEKGNRAIGAFVKHVTDTVLNGSGQNLGVLFGRSVDTVFAAVPRRGEVKSLPLSAMMDGFRNSLDAAEGAVRTQPRTIVYHVRAEDFKKLAATTGGVLDTMAHVEELLETHSREATVYLGGDLGRSALRDSLKEVFQVRAGANFLELTYAPEKAPRMMALYRKSQTEDADRAESILFARAPEDLGSLLYRGYARAMRFLGVSDHRARLWLGSRYAQAFIIPAVELFGLPGAAWLLSPLLGWGVAVVAGSALFTLLHGLPGLTRGPPALRQEWGPFLARLVISLAINAAALSVGSLNPSDQILPVFELAGIPSSAILLSYASHAGWNFLVPENYRLSLIPGDKNKIKPVTPAARPGDPLKSPKPLLPEAASRGGDEGGPAGDAVHVGLVELNQTIDAVEAAFRKRNIPFGPEDRDALHFAIRLAAPIYARTPRTDPYAPPTPYEAIRRIAAGAKSADQLIGALSPVTGSLADGLFGTARAAAFLQGKLLDRDVNTFVDLIRAGAAIEREGSLLSEMVEGGAVTPNQLRDAFLSRGPPVEPRMGGALRALRISGSMSADEIVAQVDELYHRYRLTWAERGVLYMVALTRGEGAGSVRGPPESNATDELRRLLRAARASGGIADNKWSETQRSVTQAVSLLADFQREHPEARDAVRFAVNAGHYLARFGGNERALLAGLIAGVGIRSPRAGKAFWAFIEKRGFGVQRVESLRWIQDLAATWADVHLVRYRPTERSLGAIRNQMGVVAQRLGSEDPDVVAQLLWAGKLAELAELTADATVPIDGQGRRMVQEISDVHARFAERFGQTEAATQILDEVFRLSQPARYQKLKRDFQRVTGWAYEEARDRFQKLVPEFETQLAAAGAPNAEVHGRVKGLWSISQKLANKKVSLHDVKDLFGFYVAYENASAAPGAVREAIRGLSEGEFLEDNAETHAGADYSIHKIVARLSPSTLLAGARLEAQIFDSDDFLRSKEGVAARWVYGLGKEIKPSGWVRIDRMEYTGNLRDDLKHFQRRARDNGYVYVNVELANGNTVPIRMIDSKSGGLLPSDVAAHWRVDALDNGYQGFDALLPGADGFPKRISHDEDKPIGPGAVLALRPSDSSRPDVNDAVMSFIINMSQRGRTLLMATLAQGVETLDQLANQGRHLVVSTFFNDAPFSRVPAITDLENRQLARLAKSMGFGGNVKELYAFIALLTGPSREALVQDLADYLTTDTVKARRGPAVGMTAVVKGKKVDLHNEGFQIIEITGRHDRPAVLLDVVRILKSYRIKVDDFIYLPQINGTGQTNYVIQLAVKARSSYLDRALAEIQVNIPDVPRTIEDPLSVNVEVIASRAGGRSGTQQPDVEFLEALQETNIIDNVTVETLDNGDVQLKAVVACPRGFLPFMESDLRNRFGDDAFVSVRKKNGLLAGALLPVLLAPVLTGLVGLLSATPAYSAVETAAPATLGVATYLIWGLVVLAAAGLVWRASSDWIRRRLSPSADLPPTPTVPPAPAVRLEGGAEGAVDSDFQRWVEAFDSQAEESALRNTVLTAEESNQVLGLAGDVQHTLKMFINQNPSPEAMSAVRRLGELFLAMLAVSRYRLISQSALSLMSAALPLNNAYNAFEPEKEVETGPLRGDQRDAFITRFEEEIRRLNPGLLFKETEIHHSGMTLPVVFSDDMPMSYLRVGSLMAVWPGETSGEGIAVGEATLRDLRAGNHGFISPGGITYGPYVVPFLAAMQFNGGRFADAVVEDDGAGNGFLTWAALRLGARRVISIERDAKAVEEMRMILGAAKTPVDVISPEDLKKGVVPRPAGPVVVFVGSFNDWFKLAPPQKAALLGGVPTVRLANVGPHYEEGHKQVLQASLVGKEPLSIFGGYAQNSAPMMTGLFHDIGPGPYEKAIRNLMDKAPVAEGRRRPLVGRVDHVDGSLTFSSIVLDREGGEISPMTVGGGGGAAGKILSALMAPVAGFAMLAGFSQDAQAAGLSADGGALDSALVWAGVVGVGLLAAAGYWGVRFKREFSLWLRYRWPAVRMDFERRLRDYLKSFASPSVTLAPPVRPRFARPVDVSSLSPESIVRADVLKELAAFLSPSLNPLPQGVDRTRPVWKRALRWLLVGAVMAFLVTASSPLGAAHFVSPGGGAASWGEAIGGMILAAGVGGFAGAKNRTLDRLFKMVDVLRTPFEGNNRVGIELNEFLFSIRKNGPALDAFSGALRYLVGDQPGPRQMALLRVAQRVEVLRALNLAQEHTENTRRMYLTQTRGAVARSMAAAGLALEELRKDWRGMPTPFEDIVTPVDHLAGYFMEEITAGPVSWSVERAKTFEQMMKVAQKANEENIEMIEAVREAVVDFPFEDPLPVMADTETIDMYDLADRGRMAKIVRREGVRARWQLTREMRDDVRGIAERLTQPVYTDTNKLLEIHDTLIGRIDLYADRPLLLNALRAAVFQLINSGRLNGEPYAQNRALAMSVLEAIDKRKSQGGSADPFLLGLTALTVGAALWALGPGGIDAASVLGVGETLAGLVEKVGGVASASGLAAVLSAGFVGGVIVGKGQPNDNRETDLQLYWLKLAPRLAAMTPIPDDLNAVTVTALAEIETGLRKWPVLLWFYSNRLREHRGFQSLNKLLEGDIHSNEEWLRGVAREFRDRLVIANVRELRRFSGRLRRYVEERLQETYAAAQRARDNVPLAEKEEAARRARAAEAVRVKDFEAAIENELPRDLARVVGEDFRRIAGVLSAISSDENIRLTPGALDSFARSLNETVDGTLRRWGEIEYALALRPSGDPLEREEATDELDISALFARFQSDQRAMAWLGEQGHAFYGRIPMESILRQALATWSTAAGSVRRTRAQAMAERARSIVAWMLATPQGPASSTRGERRFGLPHWTRWLVNEVLQAAGFSLVPLDRKLMGRVNRVVRRINDPRLRVKDISILTGAAPSASPMSPDRIVMAVRDQTTGRLQVRIHEETLAQWASRESQYPGYFDTVLDAALRHALARAEGVPATILESHGLTAEGVARLQDSAIYKQSVSAVVSRAHGLAAASRLVTRTDLQAPPLSPAMGPVNEALHLLAPQAWIQPLSRTINLDAVRENVNELGQSRTEKLSAWLTALRGETVRVEGRENTGDEWKVVFEASRRDPWEERQAQYEANVMDLLSQTEGTDPRRILRAQLSRDLLRLMTEGFNPDNVDARSAARLDTLFELAGRLHALGGALTLADDGFSENKEQWASTLLPAYQDLDLRLLGELGLAWLGSPNLVASLNRSAERYSHAVLQGVRLREARVAFDEALMRDGDVLFHVSPGMVSPEAGMTPSEFTQLEQIVRLNSTLFVLGGDLKKNGRFVFLTEEGVEGALPEILEAMGRKAARAGLSSGMNDLVSYARQRGQTVFARSLTPYTTHTEQNTRVDAESLFNSIPDLTSPYLFRLDQPGVSWHLGSWADRVAAELVAAMGGLVRDQARRVSEELRKVGVLRYQA